MRLVAEPAQLLDHQVEPLTRDELHRVVADVPSCSHLEDRHDVGVVQPRRGARLAAEPLQGLLIVQGVPRQDLQRHPPAQRLLLGLVDHAHAAPAHLAEDAEVAQPLRPPALGRGRSGVGPRRVAAAGLDLLDQHQGGEQVADRLGVLGEPLGVLGEVGMLAAAVPRDELLGQAIDRVLIRRARRVHGSPLRNPGCGREVSRNPWFRRLWRSFVSWFNAPLADHSLPCGRASPPGGSQRRERSRWKRARSCSDGLGLAPPQIGDTCRTVLPGGAAHGVSFTRRPLAGRPRRPPAAHSLPSPSPFTT